MNLAKLLQNFANNVAASIRETAPDGHIRRQDVGLIFVSSAVGLAAALGCSPEELNANWQAVMRMLSEDAEAEVQAKRGVMHAVDGEGHRHNPVANAKRAAFTLVGADGKPLVGDES